jgi:hypothetical protein
MNENRHHHQDGRRHPPHDQDGRRHNPNDHQPRRHHHDHPPQHEQRQAPSEASLHQQRPPNNKNGEPWFPPINRRNDQDAQANARPPRRNNDEDGKFGKLKFTMPKFKGEDDVEAYLSWALKVDKIFRVHNYSEEKKVAMASLEFEDYANVWWEQVVQLREENLQRPIATWEEMKSEMQSALYPPITCAISSTSFKS